MIKRKRWIFSLSLFSAISLALLIATPLHHRVIIGAVKYFCEKRLDAKLEYALVQGRGRQITFNQVRIHKKGYDLVAEELNIDYQLLWPRIQFSSLGGKLLLSDKEIPLNAKGTIGYSQIIEFSADFKQGLGLKQVGSREVFSQFSVDDGTLLGYVSCKYSSNGHIASSGKLKLLGVKGVYLPYTIPYSIDEISIDCDRENLIADVNVQGANIPIEMDFFQQMFQPQFFTQKYEAHLKVNHESGKLFCIGKILFNEMGDEIQVKIAKGESAFSLSHFQMDHLPTASPLKTAGDLSISGHFKEGEFFLEYALDNFVLENHRFQVTIPHLYSTSTENTLTIDNGSYLEKHTGIAFTDIHTTLSYHDQLLEAKNIETFANSVFFAGDISVDYRNKTLGRVIIEVNNHSISGKLSQIQSLVKQINFPIFINEIPIEGNICYRGKGTRGKFVFDHTPEGVQSFADIEIEGSLSDGHIKPKDIDLSVNDINLNFLYSHQTKSLVLEDIQGAVFVGRGAQTEEFMLNSERILFEDVTQNKGNFDFWIGDRHRDLLRLAGEFEGIGEEHIAFYFNQELSHFGTAHADIKVCKLNRWKYIDELSFELPLNLSDFVFDFQRITKTDLISFPKGIINQFNQLQSASGHIQAKFDYRRLSKSCYFAIFGQEILLDEHIIHQFKCLGKNHGEKYAIEQLQLDELSLAADFHREEKGIHVDFFGLQYGNVGLLGSEGIYLPYDDHLEVQLHLAELNLSKAQDISALAPFAKKYKPEGIIKTKGLLTFDLLAGSQSWLAKLDLSPSTNTFSIGGLAFKNTDRMTLQWQPKSGFTVKNFKTSLIKEESLRAVDIAISEGGYDYHRKGLWIRDLIYDIPPNHVHWILKNLHKNFSTILPSDLFNLSHQLSFNDQIKGTLSFTSRKPIPEMLLSLEDFSCLFKGVSHKINGLTLSSEPGFVNILFDYSTVPLTITSPSFAMNEGTLSVHDEDKESSIDIDWIRPAGDTFEILAAHGNYRDIYVDLKGKKTELKGSVTGNFNDLLSISDRLSFGSLFSECAIGKGFCLEGVWNLDLNEFANTRFTGFLKGSRSELFGYLFESIHAKIETKKDEVVIQNFKMSDPSGVIEIDQVHFVKGLENSWTVLAPTLKGYNLRPRHLRSARSANLPMKRPVVIKQLDLANLTGSLNNLSTLKGNGKLTFANSSDDQQKLSVPQELFKKLGTEVPSLTPVTGSIQYELSDKKFFVTKLKDVYTERKLIKFYRPKHAISYIGFDGTLHLKIGLQPYNLILKLKDLVTVSIDGTIDTPKYSIQRDLEDS